MPPWCFCHKAQDTLAFTTPSQQLRRCQVLAGAHLCMVNKSHGGADGGRTGSKTWRRLSRKVLNSKCTFFIIRKVKVKLKALPQLELSICDENTFFAEKAFLQKISSRPRRRCSAPEKVNSNSPRSSKVQ